MDHIQFTRQLVQDEKSLEKKYFKTVDWIKWHIIYDFVLDIKYPDREPDIKTCWEKHKGSNLEIATMTAEMLNGIGVNAKVCVGLADGVRRSWVESLIKGKKYRFDIISKAKKYESG